MENFTREVIVSDPFEDGLREFRITMNTIGLVTSLFGYGIMVLTALLFPSWRKTKQNQLWLHMCGSFIVYFSIHFLTYAYPIKNYILSVIFEHINRYVVRVSLCWMLAGAWLTYKNLVDVFADVGDRFIFKAALFSYITPIPFVVGMYLLYIFLHEEAHDLKIKVGCSVTNKVYSYANFYWIFNCILDNFLLVVPIVGSLLIYVCVTISLCNNRKVYGRERDLVGTVALGFYFVFTCCVQCALITAKFMFSLTGAWSYLAIVLMSFHVSTYTILFIFCNKMTRETWVQFLKGKLASGLQKPATTSFKISA